jgi:stearoyl-CoA desaturase (delta-9 desaturase)
MLRWIDSTFLLWATLGVLIPTVLGGLITMSWMGALTGMIWGGLVRILVEHHATWSVNSICHLWGPSPYKSNDHSRNNAFVGVLALGEGWHNNHHAFPTSARHGLRWWQFDLSWVAITTMKRLGLVTNVKVPSAERQEMKLRKPSPAT